MNYEIGFLLEAEYDIDEVFEQYERINPGLGYRFMRCLDETLHMICDFPESRQKSDFGLRQASIAHFPHLVFYEFGGDAILVYGVISGYQDREHVLEGRI